MTFEPNRLMIESAEVMAVELSERGEKWAAQTIAGLLLIIEDYERRVTPRRTPEVDKMMRRIYAKSTAREASSTHPSPEVVEEVSQALRRQREGDHFTVNAARLQIKILKSIGEPVPDDVQALAETGGWQHE